MKFYNILIFTQGKGQDQGKVNVKDNNNGNVMFHVDIQMKTGLDNFEFIVWGKQEKKLTQWGDKWTTSGFLHCFAVRVNT